ncbi:MAG: DUF1430 domain-containing protein [Defluviitaleaceae bacterium]|nr:DUF1430 domain-containing protein [Defluviitaleaceae bacterium]
MKQILSVLFILKFVIILMYIQLFFYGNSYHQLFIDDVISVTLNFDDEQQHYERFLALANEKGLHVSRITYVTAFSVVYYTSDLTLDGFITLASGRFPEHGTSEFISTIQTDEPTQVGVIANLIPGYDLTIGSIYQAQNFALDGSYVLHTSDLHLVTQLLTALDEFLLFTELGYFRSVNTNMLTRGLILVQLNQLFEFVFISLVITLVVISALISYVIGKLKSHAIYLLHGYSVRTVVKSAVIAVMKIVGVSSAISCVFFIGYLMLLGRHVFILPMMLFFALLMMLLMVGYALIIVLVMKGYLKRLRATALIKGNKPYLLVQLLNHGLKIVFIFFFVTVLDASLFNLQEINQRLAHLSHWQNAQNIYTINMQNVGQFRNNFAIERDYDFRKLNFYEAMSASHSGFIMNVADIDWFDGYKEAGLDAPYEYYPEGYTITVSPNFFQFNPIETLNGVAIKDQIIWDDHVLNVLIPEALMPREAAVYQFYLGRFYHQKVHVSNIFNEELNLPLYEKSIDELSVNLIYVKDNQYYFSFNYWWVSPRTGGRLLDPTVRIYTGNIDLSSLTAMMTSSFYFYTDALNPFDEILPFITESGLESVIFRVDSVFDGNMRNLRSVQEQFIRLIGFIAILMIASVTVTYSLMANYFERNKFKLFVKAKFGYGFLKRNKRFASGFLAYTLPLVLFLTLPLGSEMALIGLAFIAFDIGAAMMFERRLMKKSFSEIMKGER